MRLGESAPPCQASAPRIEARRIDPVPPPKPTAYSIVIRGDAGDGVLRAALLVARVAAKLGCDATAENLSPAPYERIPTIARIRLGAPRASVWVPPEALLAFDARGAEDLGEALKRGSVLVTEEDAPSPRDFDPRLHHLVRAPFGRIAQEAAGLAAARPEAAAGFLLALAGFPLPAIASVAEEVVAGASGDPGAAARALRAGAECAASRAASHLRDRPVAAATPKLRLDSAPAALAFALRSAGVRVVSAAPEEGVGELLAALDGEAGSGPGEPGWRIEGAECAREAVAAALGASCGGVPSAWITTGSGLAAAGEALAWASAAEVPLVVVVAQRAGAFGAPVPGVEQGDLLAAIHGGPGQFPKAVFAPSDLETLPWIVGHAVRAAEQYQLPAILLLDAVQIRTIATVPENAVPAESAPRRGAFARSPRPRYEVTPAGLSPLPIPGEPGRGFLATGRDHDSLGHQVPPGERREAQIGKRWRKFEILRQDLDGLERMVGMPGNSDLAEYEAVAIGYGSAVAAVAEGVSLASREGIRAAVVPVRALHPLPARALARIRERFDAEHVLVFEQNATGDLARHLRAELGLQGAVVGRADGAPLRPHDVLQRLRGAFAR